MKALEETLKSYSDFSVHTGGAFSNEDDAKIAFVQAFEPTECFTIYSEVECWYFGGSVFGDQPTGRIDYVLTPKKKLIDAGWSLGVIGIEVKKSGHKAGPLICQMIDYSKAVFRLPPSTGECLVSLTAVFCFPWIVGNGNAMQSIMANHRIGCARTSKWGPSLLLNSTNVFWFKENAVGCANTVCGYKNGSR